MLIWETSCTRKEVLCKEIFFLNFRSSQIDILFLISPFLKPIVSTCFNLTFPVLPLADSTMHPEHCTVYITHYNRNCKHTGNCICTLHTTHQLLCTTCRTFILHAAHVSLHNETSNICVTQDLHGKANHKICKICWTGENLLL